MKYSYIVIFIAFFFSCIEPIEELSQQVTIIESATEGKIEDIYLPDTIFFSGERVPLEKSYVKEAIQKELMVNAFRHSKALLLLKRQPRWQPMIDSVLEANNVPSDFFYLAVTESYLENTVRSGAGAVGMWQFMPKTAKEYGLRIAKDYDLRRDPWLATEAASKYLKKANKKFNNWTLTAASYNRGMRGIGQALEKQKVKSFYELYLNTETSRYIYRIISFKLILNYPEKYGFYIREEEKYKPYIYKEERITKNIMSMVDYAVQNETTYKELRLLNPWFNNASTFSLRIKKGDTLSIRIPY